MNNAPITLILVASLGLIAVLSLGIFFAVRPRSKTTVFYYGDWSGDEKEWTTPSPAGLQIQSSTEKSTTVIPTVTFTRKIDNESWYTPPKKTWSTAALEIPTISRTPITTTTVLATIAPVRGRRPLPKEERRSENNRLIIMGHDSSPTQLVLETEPATPRNTAINRQEISAATQDLAPLILAPTEEAKQNDLPQWTAERKMTNYRKVVGIAYKDGFLFAPSHETGNISILSTPDLRLVKEIPCEKCRIYDVGVMSNGDVVVAQGRRKKLSKISSSQNRIIKEIHLNYATKGLAVSDMDEIFVLGRSHDKIYKYSADLEALDTIFLPNEAFDDCNFLAVTNGRRLAVSCENDVYVVDADSGEFIHSLKPLHGSYSVGIASDDQGKLLVVQRGRSEIDVYSRGGTLERTIGRPEDTLLSDIAVGGDRVYMVDYIHATIRAIQYP